MTRQEHLEQAKELALDSIGTADPVSVFSTLVSDLRKHPETANHPDITLGALYLGRGLLDSTDELKRFIEGLD